MTMTPIIGLDMFHYALITETDGVASFGEPKSFKAIISINTTPEVNEARLYADNILHTMERQFREGSFGMNVVDITPDISKDLFGTSIDDNGVTIYAAEDIQPYVAIGFRASKSGGIYRYIWYYKAKFSVPSVNYATKGETTTFQTPTFNGSFMPAQLAGSTNRRWQAHVDSDAENIGTVIDGWFTQVYIPGSASSTSSGQAAAQETEELAAQDAQETEELAAQDAQEAETAE